MSPAAPGRQLLYAEKKAVSWTSLPFVFVLERQLLENILVVFLPLLLFTYFYFFSLLIGDILKREDRRKLSETSKLSSLKLIFIEYS